MFKQVKQNKVYQDVVEQIQEAIMEGSLKPGSQLPAERELKEQFGISRGTLREALRVLEQKGLIEIRTGVAGGSIIREANSEQLSENLGLLLRNRTVSLGDLADFREGIEGAVAALAARRAGDRDRELLQGLLGEARLHLEEGIAGWDPLFAPTRSCIWPWRGSAPISSSLPYWRASTSIFIRIMKNFSPRGRRSCRRTMTI